MDRKLRFGTLALDQLVRIEDYYNQVNPEVGRKVISSIDYTLQRVSENPLQFPKCHFAPDYRFAIVLDYRQYSVIYDFDNELIYINAVWNSRQDPQQLAEY